MAASLGVIKLEFSLKLKIKSIDLQLADTFRFILNLRMNSSFITSMPGCYALTVFLDPIVSIFNNKLNHH